MTVIEINLITVTLSIKELAGSSVDLRGHLSLCLLPYILLLYEARTYFYFTEEIC